MKAKGDKKVSLATPRPGKKTNGYGPKAAETDGGIPVYNGSKDFNSKTMNTLQRPSGKQEKQGLTEFDRTLVQDKEFDKKWNKMMSGEEK